MAFLVGVERSERQILLIFIQIYIIINENPSGNTREIFGLTLGDIWVSLTRLTPLIGATRYHVVELREVTTERLRLLKESDYIERPRFVKFTAEKIKIIKKKIFPPDYTYKISKQPRKHKNGIKI